MADEPDLTPGGPDGAWLRAQLDPIVSVPAAPALDAIWARRDGEPDLAPAARRRRPPTAGLVALAAAAAILVAFLVVRDRADAPPKRIASTVPDPTGWYVPQGLPDGWTLHTVEASASPEPRCEGEGTSWTDLDATRTVGLTRSACGELPTNPLFPASSGVPGPDEGGPGIVEVDLGGGTTGAAYALGEDLVAASPSPFAPADRTIVWPADDGGTWTLRTIGVDEEPFLDAARALAADPGAGAAEVGAALGTEVEEVDRWDAPGGEPPTSVQLGITSPSGQGVELILASPGGGTHPEGSSIALVEEVPGQPNPVWRFDDPSWAVRFGGAWPGADLSIVRIAQDPADWIDDDQLRTLLASLRPASAAEWRAYLDTATGTVDEEARTAPTLAQLFDPTEAAATTSAPTTAPPPPDDPTTTSPTTTPPASDGPFVSARSVVEPGDGGSTFSDLTGLEVQLEVDAERVASGETVGARLRWTNTTDEQIVVNECSWLLIQSGIVAPGYEDADVPSRSIIDCYDTDQVVVPPNDLVTTELPDGLAARAASGDTIGLDPLADPLVPGDYLAVVLIPGEATTIRIELPITVTDG